MSKKKKKKSKPREWWRDNWGFKVDQRMAARMNGRPLMTSIIKHGGRFRNREKR